MLHRRCREGGISGSAYSLEAVESFARPAPGKLTHEHIYWNQASVLKQIGLL